MLTAEGAIDLATQDKIWRLASDHGLWPGVTQTVPGVNNLLILFDPDVTTAEALTDQVLATWNAPPEAVLAPSEHIIPVRYGGETGVDLTEVAETTGLSPDDYASRHAAGQYTVMTVGAYPGFGFLGGLNPALAVPRRAAPRHGVPAGAVMIGGAQTAVMTTTSPSGWNVIGSTDARLLDLTRPNPAILRPGDRVRFVLEAVL